MAATRRGCVTPILASCDDLLVVTGRGAHSRVSGVSTVKQDVSAFLDDRGAAYSRANEGAILLLRRPSPGAPSASDMFARATTPGSDDPI